MTVRHYRSRRTVSDYGNESGLSRAIAARTAQCLFESNITCGVPSIHDVRARFVTPENVGLTVAVFLSLVGAYAIQLRVSAGIAAFFGLIVLGVSTPTTLTSHSLLGTRFASAVARVSVACTATFVTYVGLLTTVSGWGGSLLDAAVAFSLTALAVEGVARMLD